MHGGKRVRRQHVIDGRREAALALIATRERWLRERIFRAIRLDEVASLDGEGLKLQKILNLLGSQHRNRIALAWSHEDTNPGQGRQAKPPAGWRPAGRR